MPTQAEIQSRLAESQARRDRHVAEIRRFEALAAQDPEAYARRLYRFSYLGSAYVVAMLLLVLLLLAAVVTFIVVARRGIGAAGQFGIFLLIAGYGIVRSLWIKIEPPEGRLVLREELPELYAEVDRISASLGAPRIHEIRIDLSVNAAAAERPRFGVLGGYRMTLLLGAPLLVGMAPDQVRSIIAHELGHFSGRHGKLGLRVYRVHETWSRLFRHFSEHSGGWLFSGFAKWYMPTFDAMSFAIRREHEFHADAAEVATVGAEVSGRAFVRMAALNHLLKESFWNPLWKENRDEEAPRKGLAPRLREALRQPADAALLARHLRFDLEEETSPYDSHPSLKERFDRMGFATEGRIEELAEEAAVGPTQTFAEAIGGGNPARFDAILEAELGERYGEIWVLATGERKDLAASLDELDRQRGLRELTQVELSRYAIERRQYDGDAAAEPLLRAHLERYPTDAQALFALADIASNRGDEEAVALAERAEAADPQYADAIYGMLRWHYRQLGDHPAFAKLSEHAEATAALAEVDADLAQHLDPAEEFESAEWPPVDLAAFGQWAAADPDLDSAYYVKKKLPATGAFAFYVILLVAKKAVVLDRAHHHRKLLKRARESGTLPTGYLVVPYDVKTWRRALERRSIPPVYARKRGKAEP